MMIDEIKRVIESSVPDSTVYVNNPRMDDVHFEAIVISPTFDGQSLVKQHQLVMNSLKEEFQTRVHALALKTFTPEKWELEKGRYSEMID